MNAYEKVHSSALRNRALDACLEQMRFEDWTTKYICIGPVNKTLNMVCAFFAEGAESDALTRHRERIDDYLWLSADGMKMQGYNGSQLWDTVFSVQALADAGLSDDSATSALYKAYAM